MNELPKIPVPVPERLNEIVDLSWKVFANQYINEKYKINLEAPFQLHFATILKKVGEIYCIQKNELFTVNLETVIGNQERNYVDIVISLFDKKTNKEFSIPIELKYKTLKQGAEDIGAMNTYKDIYYLEKIKNQKIKDKEIPFCYFFFITNNHRYVKESRSGLRKVFKTNDRSEIQSNFSYKYLENKTGRKYYEKNGEFIFSSNYQFLWNKLTQKESSSWFLSLKI